MKLVGLAEIVNMRTLNVFLYGSKSIKNKEPIIAKIINMKRKHIAFCEVNNKQFIIKDDRAIIPISRNWTDLFNIVGEDVPQHIPKNLKCIIVHKDYD